MKIQLQKILVVLFIFSGLIYFGIIFNNRHNIFYAVQQVEGARFMAVFSLSCIFLFFGHTIRSYKMNKIMQPVKEIKLKTNLRALFIGYLFDILLPFRIGQLIRAYVLGSAERISIGYTFSMIVLERAVDAAILGFFSLFLFNYSIIILGVNLQQFTVISLWLIGISLFLFTILEVFYTQNKQLLRAVHYTTTLLRPTLKDKLRLSVWSTIYGLQKTLKPKAAAKYLGYSLVMWASYICATYILASYIFSFRDVFTEVVRATSSYLGMAVPTGPSYFGVFEALTSEILNTLWVSPSTNTYIVISWILLAVPTSIAGIYALWRTKENFRVLSKTTQLSEMHDKLLRNSDMSSELTAFLESYFTGNTLSQILHNIELQQDVRLVHYFKGGSNASTILVHTNNSYKVRKITPIQHAPKLIAQQKWLERRKHLDKIASIQNVYKNNEYYSFDITYYKDYMPFFDYIHSHKLEDSVLLLNNIIEFMFKNVYSQKKEQSNPEALNQYIQKRFIDKLVQTEQLSIDLGTAATLPKLIINGKTYDNALKILGKIQNNPLAMSDLACYKETPVHGDLTIDNILASTKQKNDFRILDPNDENEIASAVIDFAKLFQSLAFGYEFLCRNNDPVKLINSSIEFENSTSASYEKLYLSVKKIAKIKLTPKEYKSIDFHVGMMYLRMLPYRVNIDPENLLKFYAIAVISFNNFYQQYEK